VAPAELLAHTSFEGEVRRLVELRAAQLIGYQNAEVAHRYIDTVESVWAAERSVTERTEFSEAVARGLFKFTAYKDEYEVARLLVDPDFLADVQAQVPGGEKLTYKLHPPVLRAMGRDKKIGLRPKSHVALKVLAKGKFLRGTKLDPFGYAHVRKVERELLAHYTDMVRRLAGELTVENYETATAAAALTDVVRGYEDIKLANVELYRAGLRELGVAY
jgi:indolepyruvate ferredoxin oxidoreductase